jgi:DNA-binding MarR family transcriptional regulator
MIVTCVDYHGFCMIPIITGQQTRVATPLDARGTFLLSQLGHHTATRCAQLLAPMGLQPAHFGILNHLVQAEGITQQQLADTLKLHRNVMVGLIDDLEDRRLVERHRHPRDRRAHQIRLTERARSILAEANQTIDGLEDEIFAPFTDSERADLIGLLHRAVAHANLSAGIHPGLVRRKGAVATMP